MMQKIKSAKLIGFCIVTLLAVCLLGVYNQANGAFFAANSKTFLQDDLSISANKLTPSVYDGKPVLIASGNVIIKAGGYTYTCKQAVLWGKMTAREKVSRRKFEIYLEGMVTATNPDGDFSRFADSLLKLNIKGRLKFGKALSKPVAKPAGAVFKRALAARRFEFNKKFYAPPVVDDKGPGTEDKAGKTSKGQTNLDLPPVPKKDEKYEPIKGGDLTPIVPENKHDKSGKPDFNFGNGNKNRKPNPDRKVSPVSIDVDGLKFESEMKNGKPTGKRICVLKSKFHITQGGETDKDHLILSADRGVVFTEKYTKKQKQDKVPYDAPVFATPDGGKITGVYLEGDVVIRQGERTVTAKNAYFDFRFSRAIVIEPVFRTIQEQRNIPIYIRGSRMEMLSDREMKFHNAVVTTEDFSKPTYSIKAARLRVKDQTEYDKEGDRLSEQKSLLTFHNAYVDVFGVPVLPMGSGQGSFERGHTALRRAGVGGYKDFGPGFRTQWHLFRLLGMVKPSWLDAHVNAEFYEKGAVLGIDGKYARREESRHYSGYFRIDGVYDRKHEDDFGRERENILAPRNSRGRVLARHKEYLADDWMIQAELSLLSDRNFLEKYFPSEFWNGKDQENVVYARKQRDNWAITAMVKGRFNSFLTQTETFPELAAYMVGEPLFNGAVTYFGEVRGSAQRYQYGDPLNQNQNLSPFSSPAMFTFDTRHELTMPLELETQAGSMHVVPFVGGRFSYWSKTPSDRQRAQQSMPAEDFQTLASMLSDETNGGETRFYGIAGVRASMSFWKLYHGIKSDFWDINGIRHIVTPELVVYTGGSSVAPTDLYNMNSQVEPYIRDNTGVGFAVYNRLQTKRGPAGNQRVVDWMKFNVRGAYFTNPEDRDSGHGELYVGNPEYSRARNYLAAEWTWNMSDSATILADASFDLDNGRADMLNIGASIRRDPRLSYFLGFRYNQELDYAVATVGADYKINRKFTIRALEKYDFKYDGGLNLSSNITLIRKLPRWYMGLTFGYDARYSGADEYSIMLTIWPEGIPEFLIRGASRFNYSGRSSDN